jgi:mannose-1-phosphate guanylyltransferase
MATRLWTVVLAAGAGRRLSGVTGGVPKQFWRGTSGGSLLAQTMERFSPLAPRSRTVVVVDAGHRGYVSGERALGGLRTTVCQPEDRGTAVGALLALTPVFASDDEDAVVTITPADHGVIDDSRFRRGLLEAAGYVGSRSAIVLFGVQPAEAQADYGWITPGPGTASSAFRPVMSFVEKPSPADAARLLTTGAVWNTMVLVARARVLRALFVRLLPDVARVFEAALRLTPPEREAFFASVYPHLPSRDFSRDVLTRARDLSTYIWPASVGWSDLGTPERLQAWQTRTGRHAIAAAQTRSFREGRSRRAGATSSRAPDLWRARSRGSAAGRDTLSRTG